MNKHAIVTFDVVITGDLLSNEIKPIYDMSLKKLLGGFILKTGNIARGFISANEPPYCLFISSEQPFYFTPKENAIDGKIEYAVISELYLSALSCKVENYTISLL